LNSPQSPADVIRDRKRFHIIVSATLGFFALITVVILGRGLFVDVSKVPSALLDKPAKAFVVDWLSPPALAGVENATNLRLADFAGRPIILNFWASWCVSCRAEAGYFEEFWRKHKDDGLVMIGIAIQDTDADAKRFADFFGKTYILGIDRDGKAGIDYGVYGVPETFFIDRSGIIRHKEAGPVDTKMLAEHLKKIL